MFDLLRTMLALQVLVFALTALDLTQSSIDMLGVRGLDLILEGCITYALYKVATQDFSWYPKLLPLVGCGIVLDAYISYLTQDWGSLILMVGVIVVVLFNPPKL